ncbi:MAG: hypothetical protein K2Q15_12960, partial [Burkholderiales bacterium]|nr:hypothetical protein [Burkholderiales bacterium]
MSSISFASPYGDLSKIKDEINSHILSPADVRKDMPVNATSLLIKYEWVQNQVTEALQKAAAECKKMKALVRTMLTKIKTACLTSNLQRANRSRSGSTRRARTQSLSKAGCSDPDGEAPHLFLTNSSLLQFLPLVSNSIQQVFHRYQNRSRSIYAAIMHVAHQLSTSLKNISQAESAKKDT